MLQTTHDANRVEPPRFLRPASRPRSDERVLEAMRPVYQDEGTTPSAPALGDAGELTVHELIHRHLELRDELAYRRLRGDALTVWETLTLRVLNEVARRIMPPTERLSQETLDAMEEARQLGARRRKR